MSIETVCKICGEEYDARRGRCPACYSIKPNATTKFQTAGEKITEVDAEIVPETDEMLLITVTPYRDERDAGLGVTHQLTGLSLTGPTDDTVANLIIKAQRFWKALGPGQFVYSTSNHPVILLRSTPQELRDMIRDDLAGMW